jgi:hypothetical protein
MEPKWRRQVGGTRGRQYAALAGRDRAMAVRVLQERGFVEMANPNRHMLKIGEYRVWAGEEGLTWVEPPTFYSAVRAGKAELYESLTGRRR